MKLKWNFKQLTKLYFVTCLFLGINNDLFSQKSDTTKKDEVGGLFTLSSLDINYGYYDFNLNKLNEDLAPASFSNNFNLVGFNFYQNIGDGNSQLSGFMQMGMWWFLPQEDGVANGPGYKLKGVNYNLHFGLDVFGNLPWLDLNIGGGMTTGKMTLKTTDYSLSSEEMKYNNPYFTFDGFGELRINTLTKRTGGGLTFGVRAMYNYDVTYGAWNLRNEELPKIRTGKLSGFSLQGFIGIIASEFISSQQKKQPKAFI